MSVVDVLLVSVSVVETDETVETVVMSVPDTVVTVVVTTISATWTLPSLMTRLIGLPSLSFAVPFARTGISVPGFASAGTVPLIFAISSPGFGAKSESSFLVHFRVLVSGSHSNLPFSVYAGLKSRPSIGRSVSIWISKSVVPSSYQTVSGT